MKGFGLLAVDRRLIGRRDRRLNGHHHARADRGVAFFVLTAASESGPGPSRGAEGNSVEPGAEPVRIAERAGPAGQDEEHGLEGVFGEMAVAQELPADVQDHRAMSRHQRGESGLAGGIPAATNRSMRWRSESPATAPPSKSDPICRTTDGVVTLVMSAGSVAEILFALTPL